MFIAVAARSLGQAIDLVRQTMIMLRYLNSCHAPADLQTLNRLH